MFSTNFKRNEKIENTLKKVSNVDDKNGGATPAVVITGILVAASTAQCPTLACSSRCGKRKH
ncbi:TPA: class II lanthipeptide, LchA2/BrtA2 family [Staphylococcus aureus]|uniref:class II lanthipeptide, LchA2/BrtA2 family n=1 Tax=Staphylococcus aureus TaxID=1280 RepID=UPI00085CCCD1|nr:class II lanthipeptide, LchA2/BrtA2 family [Staphylococcus aureus]MBU6985144.1 class II lanthipeptide, LchA2/BrtA2 family [Staphylococcus aureus]MBV5110239.1 class II lanthipeptide, LchA2/BrtA2 family [Staphylococcus aureus]MCG5197433.1 class II lanthipeptide, LchA2/BrtA2 family [Staphylococcus aureus]OHW10108.1 hypothetical protein BKL87_13620 [Staphylococcus aureus]UVI90128.1 class II lanthipeptide, LchA2/BrtA2 family [Staphylococcus aureus]